MPAVLTANHHGVDFLAQSVQGSLIFSLRKVGGKPATTVPVFACGNIPLDNSTYPRGLLLYHVDRQASNITLPVRLPIFQNRYRRKLVSIVDAFNEEMLKSAEQCLTTMVRNKQLTSLLAATVAIILDVDYRNSMVIKLKSYSQQAVIINNRIWKRCFREPEQAPEMVYIELEKITSLLLQADLNNEDSLVWQIMFNPTLRSEVLVQLDGAKACWDQYTLAKRVQSSMVCKELGASNCGTYYFWAINDAGRRVSLLLTDETSYSPALQGRDDHGKLWTIPFNPKDILDGLAKERLLPSLFVCFLSIAFARGISCFGGYFQAEYLAVMQRGLVRALSESGDYLEFAEQISRVPSDIYLSGMQAVMRNLDDDLLLPAGPVEIIASGGLSWSQLKQVRLLNVRDVHLAGLTETLPDFQTREEHREDWPLLFAEECSQMLRDRIVVI